MNGRTVAVSVILTLAMLLFCTVPLLSEDTEATDYGDYIITMPQHQGPDKNNFVLMTNGESKTIVIYILNDCDCRLDIGLYTVSEREEIHSEWTSNVVLEPKGAKGDLLKYEYVLETDEVMPSCHNVDVSLVVYVTDITDGTTQFTTIHFSVTVYSSYDISDSDNKFFGTVDNDLPVPFNTSVTPFIVTLLVYIAVALIIIKLSIIVATRFMTENTSDHERMLIRMSLRTSILFIALALFTDLGVRILGMGLFDYVRVHKAVVSVIVAMSALLIWQVYSLIMDNLIWRLGRKDESFIDPSLVPILSVLVKLTLWVGGIAIIMHLYGMDFSSIMLSAGIVTLGITLGAQSVLSQFFSGISLLVTRPFNRGDYVEMNGHTYIVKKVKVMYTEFYGVEKDRVITMPNNAVLSSTIINMSKYDKAYRMYIDFEIPAKLDVKKVEEIMLQLAEESEYVVHDDDKYSDPRVKFMDFKGTNVQMRLDATIRNFGDLPEIQSQMKRGLFIKLAEAGMNTPMSKLGVKVVTDESSDESDGKSGEGVSPDM